MFSNGPTEDNLKAAYAVGAIAATPGAFSVFPAWWHQTNMQQAAADAMALANRVMDTEHDPSMADLNQFKDLLAKYANDPAFAYYFLNALGPRHLLELNGQISTLQLSYYDNGNQLYFDRDLATTVGAIQTSLGLALAAATQHTGQRSYGGNYTPGPYELSPKWVVDLLQAARTTASRSSTRTRSAIGMRSTACTASSCSPRCSTTATTTRASCPQWAVPSSI